MEHIVTARLTLRSLEARDLPIFAAYRADPDVSRYQSWESYDLQKAHLLLEKQLSQAFGSEGSWHQIAVLDNTSLSVLGDCCIHFCDDTNAEIGFTLAPEHQHQGYCTEAIAALLGYLFGDLEKHRVYATVDVLNLQSVAVLERLKFRREAHFLENVWFKGRWSSEYVYAIISDEYLSSLKESPPASWSVR